MNGLVPGKYVLKETKAPEGYSLSANVWQVLVRDNQSVEVTLNGVPVEKAMMEHFLSKTLSSTHSHQPVAAEFTGI